MVAAGGSILKILLVMNSKMLMSSSFQCLTKSMRKKPNLGTKIKVIEWRGLLFFGFKAIDISTLKVLEDDAFVILCYCLMLDSFRILEWHLM